MKLSGACISCTLRCTGWKKTKKWKTTKSKKWYLIYPKNHDQVRQPVVTENQNIRENKPDLLIHDLKTRDITIVEVGITNKNIPPVSETTKAWKYELLANELTCIHLGTRTKQIPVVMTWDGLVTNHFKQLGIFSRLQAYIQIVVLKRTCESIDCR